MKRAISTILSILLIMSAFSVTVFATNDDSITRDDLMALACDVFPEYEEQIKGINLSEKAMCSIIRNEEASKVIISKTRTTDAGEVFTYQEDQRGIVTVTYSHGSEIVDSSSGTGYVYRKCNIYVYCNASAEKLQVIGFEYTHVQNGYDNIISGGSTSGSTVTVNREFIQTNETATMRAFAQYHVSFTSNLPGVNGEFNVYLQVEVGNDSYRDNVFAE